jgi:hypothetical protein
VKKAPQADSWENVSLAPINTQIKKLQYTPYSTYSATILTHFFKSRTVRTGKENGANSDTLLEIPCYVLRKATHPNTHPHMRTESAAVTGSWPQHPQHRTTLNFFFNAATAPSGPGPPHYRGFTITLRHITLGRTPLDEWSSRTDSTQQSQKKDTRASGGSRTRNPSKWAAADRRPRTHGHRDRQQHVILT